MRILKSIAALVLASSVGHAAAADDFTAAALGLCEKIRACTLEQLNDEEITPEVRQMMEPMLQGMCSAMQSKIQSVEPGHKLYKPSVSCMQSMSKLSCEAMQDEAQVMTPECKAYEAEVEKLYPEGVIQ
jgi:hypothetical protein